MHLIWTSTFLVITALAGTSLLAVPAEEPVPPPAQDQEAQPTGDVPAPEDLTEAELMVTNGPPTNLVSETAGRGMEPAAMPEEPESAGAGADQTAPAAPVASTSPERVPPTTASNQGGRDRLSGSSDRRTRSEEWRGRSDSSRALTGEAVAGGPLPEGFAAFRLITERNIFDPNRRPRRAEAPRETPRERPRTVESFRLVGVMSYEKGQFAFFDGSSAAYQKVLKHADEIAGFRVAAIGTGSVKLANEDQEVELKVGSQMRREESGSWEASGVESEVQTSTASAAPPSAAAVGGGGEPDNDVLKRLMQRREQE